MRSEALDGLRGASAQVVFIAHLSIMAEAFRPLWLGHFLGWSARAAVIIFFCLSGFVIAWSTRQSCSKGKFNLLRFALRRIARIYPPYILAIVISWIAYLLTTSSDARSVASVLGELTRALGFLNKGSDVLSQQDGALWSLRLEVIAYVIAGLVAYSANRYSVSGSRSVLAMTFAILLALATSIKLAFGFSALCWFALGTLAATQPTYPLVGRWSVAAVAMIFFIGAPVTASETFAIGAADTIPATIYQVCFAFFVAGWIKQLADERTSIFDAFQSLGAYSYTLYVIHIPLITIALAICSPLANFSLLTIATLATTFAAVQLLAYALGLALERPHFFYAIMEAGVSRIRLARRVLSG